MIRLYLVYWLWVRPLCALRGHDLCLPLNYELAWTCRCATRKETHLERLFS